MGIGDWGLGIGDWAQSPIPNPQSPIPKPYGGYNPSPDSKRIPKLDDILFKSGISKLFKEFDNWEDGLINKEGWDPQQPDEIIEYNLDTILDKILKHGKESLTKVELKFLKNYGKEVTTTSIKKK